MKKTYIVPGVLLDFKEQLGWEIYTTNKGQYTFPGSKGGKYMEKTYPKTSNHPFEYLYGGINFFINKIAAFFDDWLLKLLIFFAFILGITFIFVYAFKQK